MRLIAVCINEQDETYKHKWYPYHSTAICDDCWELDTNGQRKSDTKRFCGRQYMKDSGFIRDDSYFKDHPHITCRYCGHTDKENEARKRQVYKPIYDYTWTTTYGTTTNTPWIIVGA